MTSWIGFQLILEMPAVKSAVTETINDRETTQLSCPRFPRHRVAFGFNNKNKKFNDELKWESDYCSARRSLLQRNGDTCKRQICHESLKGIHGRCFLKVSSLASPLTTVEFTLRDWRNDLACVYICDVNTILRYKDDNQSLIPARSWDFIT